MFNPEICLQPIESGTAIQTACTTFYLSTEINHHKGPWINHNAKYIHQPIMICSMALALVVFLVILFEVPEGNSL